MRVEILTRPAFAVVGVEGRGPAGRALRWVRPLWERARSRAAEVRGLISGDAWGLMSAVDTYLARWGAEGRYLAGWEVTPRTKPPREWAIWEVPPTSFAVIGCRLAGYSRAWRYVEDHRASGGEYVRAGAVHEFYPSEFSDPETDPLYLYFTLVKR